MFMTGLLLFGLALIAWFLPNVVIYPFVVVLVWISLALVYRAYRLKIGGDNPALPPFNEPK